MTFKDFETAQPTIASRLKTFADGRDVLEVFAGYEEGKLIWYALIQAKYDSVMVQYYDDTWSF